VDRREVRHDSAAHVGGDHEEQQGFPPRHRLDARPREDEGEDAEEHARAVHEQQVEEGRALAVHFPEDPGNR
jgi:hypothetical protein